MGAWGLEGLGLGMRPVDQWAPFETPTNTFALLPMNSLAKYLFSFETVLGMFMGPANRLLPDGLSGRADTYLHESGENMFREQRDRSWSNEKTVHGARSQTIHGAREDRSP